MGAGRLAVPLCRNLLAKKAPFRAGIGNAEAFPLGITMRITAWLGHKHGEVTTMRDGVAHALVQEGGLQAAMAQFGNCRRSGKQRNPAVDAEHTGSPRFSIKFGQEAHAIGARGRYRSNLQQKIAQFRVLVGPAARADIGPKVRLIGSYGPCIRGTRLLAAESRNGLV